MAPHTTAPRIDAAFKLATAAPATVGTSLPAGRIGYAETIRGLTCLLVVCYHAIGNDPSHGIHAEAGSLPWLAARLLDVVDMPLFAFVSGRVFGIPTGDDRIYLAALLRKAVRLGVPLITVTTIFLFVSRLSHHDLSIAPWQAYFVPFEHLWFLQSSLCLMLAASIGTWLFGGRRVTFAVVALLVAVIAYLSIPVEPSLFSWRNAVSLAPFYFLGVLLNASTRAGSIGFEGRSDRLDTAIFGTFLMLGLLALWATGAPFDEGPEQFRSRLLIGVSAVLLLATHAPRSTLLAKLAERSYTIYLFHVFVMSPTRMVVVKIWPDAPISILLIASIAVGLGVPWLMHGVLMRHPLTAFLFQGVMPAAAKPPARVPA